VRCNHCSKTFTESIFIFKHHLDGIRYDSKPYVLVSEKIKVLIIKVVSNVKEPSVKKKKKEEEG